MATGQDAGQGAERSDETTAEATPSNGGRGETTVDASDDDWRGSAMATLHEATREIVSAESKQDVAEVALDAAADVLGFTHSGVHFIDEDARALAPVAWTGSLEDEVGEPPALGPDSMAWEVFESGSSICVDDLWDNDGVHNPDTPFRSEMVLPIGEHGVALFSSTEPVAFDADDRRFAEVLCSNATAALDRIGREQELRRRIELQARLTEDVERSVEELSETARSVSGSSQQISALAGEQAGAMSDVTGGIAEMSAVIEEIASLSDQVKRRSESALELAEDGRGSVTRAADVMEEIEGATVETAREFDDLREQITDIDEMVEVINSVADRTNLLALNASIEAARAGDAGQGFAVVAEEVKALAEEAQQQASRIESRVEGIQANTAGTVETLQTATNRVQEGLDEMEETSRRFGEIVDAVTETAHGIDEVAAATDDQASSSEEIAALVDEAERSAEEVSAEVQEIAAANQQQADMVDAIRESLERAEGDGGRLEDRG